MDKAAVQREIDKNTSKQAQQQRQLNRIKEKIGRLREAERKIAVAKQDMSALNNEVVNRRNMEVLWKGNHYDKYMNEQTMAIINGQKQYYNGMDRIHDEIIRKIAQLENEASQVSGAIRWLTNGINQLKAEINTMVN